MKKITWLFLLYINGIPCSSLLSAQETGFPFIRHYSSKEYDNTSQVWGAIQDDNGIMYFGMTNGGGITEYDGKEWRVIDIPNKTTVFSFAKDSNGIIYTGAINDFGYLTADSLGKKVFVTLRHLIRNQEMKFRAVWQTIIMHNAVYFLSVEAIFKYTSSPEPAIKTYLPGKESSFMGIFSHNGKVYVYEKDRGLMRVEDDGITLVSSFYKDKPFRQGNYYASDSILISTRNAGAFIFHNSSRRSTPFGIQDRLFNVHPNIYSTTILPAGYFVISTLTDGVKLISPNGNIVQRWNENNVLTTSSVYSMFLSYNNNLWFMTENGIAKTDVSLEWSYWNNKNGLHGTVSDVLRFHDTLFVATFEGIYFVNKHNMMEKVSGLPSGQCWSLFDFTVNRNTHILLAGTPGGIYEIKGKTSILARSGKYGLAMHRSLKNRNRMFIVDDPLLASIRYENGKWIDEGIIEGVRDNIRRVEEDASGDLWLGTYNAGVIRVTMDQNSITKPKAIRYFTQKDGLPSLRTVLPYIINNEIVFATEKGLYVCNSGTDRFEPYRKIHPRLYNGEQDIEKIAMTNNGSIIIFPLSNKRYDPGILQPEHNGEYTWNYKPFRRFERTEFNAVHQDSDGVLWIGTTDGLFRYDAKQDLKNYDAGFSTLIRKVTTKNDSIVSYGGNISSAVVSYDNNDVTFHIAAPFFDDESKTVFSYQLQGYDKEWSSWSSTARAVYTNLDEGTYTLQAKAKNLYDKESAAATFTLEVLPPWYRTRWAYLSYFLFLIVSIGRFDTWNKKRLKLLHDKEHQEEKERQQLFARMLIERQEEERKRISREMHDGVGQELLILKHNLQLKLREGEMDDGLKQMLEEQSVAASNIITEVRNISHDLRPPELDRLGLTETIKSLLKRIRSTKELEVAGEIDDVDGFFRKEDEINIVRIIQESLNNVLKHAQATSVNVVLSLVDGYIVLTISDNGKGMGSHPKQSHGLGMNDINERVQLLEGTMQMESLPGKGTTLKFQFTKKKHHG